jgi:hypothetical protein
MPLTKVISQETIKIKILWNKLFFIATGNWQLICAIANAQWQMIKDSVLFALSSGFSVSLFHFYLKKKID